MSDEPTPGPVTDPQGQPSQAPAPAGTTPAPQGGPADPGVSVPQTTASGKPVWDGNPESLPPELRERANEMLRHFTIRSEQIAEDRRAADEYRRLTTDPTYQSWKAGGSLPQQVVSPNAQPQQVDWSQIDTSNPQVIAQMIDQKLAAEKAALQTWAKTVDERQATVQRQQQLIEFAQLHPDVYDLMDAGIMIPVTIQKCRIEGKTLNDAYVEAKRIYGNLKSKGVAQVQQTVQEKRNGMSQLPTRPMVSDTVPVKNHKEARRMAIELAMEGTKKRVTVEPIKK